MSGIKDVWTPVTKTTTAVVVPRTPLLRVQALAVGVAMVTGVDRGCCSCVGSLSSLEQAASERINSVSNSVFMRLLIHK